MWRNGSGHRAVRSSGPRSHASGNDQAKKNGRLATDVQSSLFSVGAVEAAEEQEAKRLAGGGRNEMRMLEMRVSREQREAAAAKAASSSPAQGGATPTLAIEAGGAGDKVAKTDATATATKPEAEETEERRKFRLDVERKVRELQEQLEQEEKRKALEEKATSSN